MIRTGVLAAALTLGACATDRVPVAASSAATVSPKLAGMQYLYGSGEAAAITRQAWAALVSDVRQRLAQPQPDSVVLAEGATLAAPRFVPCGDRPKAAVFDVDETVLLNLGFEQDDLTGADGRDFGSRWAQWEAGGERAVAATPGAREALAQLRAAGVTVVFNTNRKDADGAARALVAAGIGPATHLDTLFVQGDDATGSHKDARRWRISQHYCVVALGGDQLGDFSDLFDDTGTPAERRARTELPAIAGLWGHGWFVFPNPVYGKALKGQPDDIFPADTRWTPPAQEK